MQELIEVRRLIVDKTSQQTSIVKKTMFLSDIISVEEGDEMSKEDLGFNILNCITTVYGEFWVVDDYVMLNNKWNNYIKESKKRIKIISNEKRNN